jgi:hypothetical protein
MTAKRPKTGGRVKGVRNKVTAKIKDLAQPYGAEALDILATIMRNAEASENARVSAAKELLDRAFGKAPQAHAGDEDGPPIRHVHEIIRRVVDAGNPDA